MWAAEGMGSTLSVTFVTLGRACLGWMGEGWASHRGMSVLEGLELERGEGRRLPIGGPVCPMVAMGRDPGWAAGGEPSRSGGPRRPGLLSAHLRVGSGPNLGQGSVGLVSPEVAGGKLA